LPAGRALWQLPRATHDPLLCPVTEQPGQVGRGRVLGVPVLDEPPFGDLLLSGVQVPKLERERFGSFK
jgi:hypothetical protein